MQSDIVVVDIRKQVYFSYGKDKMEWNKYHGYQLIIKNIFG